MLPAWLEVYVGLERAAALIRTYETQFVTGLLQTEAYATAVIRLGNEGASAAEIHRRAQLRLARQQLLAAASRHACALSSTKRYSTGPSAVAR